jgi:hypothetical protein
MWTMVKNLLAMKKATFQLQDVQNLGEEKFFSIIKEEWLHVQDVKEKYIQKNTWSITLPRNLLSSLSHLIQT